MDTSPNTIRMLIDCWKSQCELGEVPSPAGLALALGLDELAELEALRDNYPDLSGLIRNAYTWMAAQWYAMLQEPAKNVNAQGIIFALRTMGYQDNPKKGTNQKAFAISLMAGHENL